MRALSSSFKPVLALIATGVMGIVVSVLIAQSPNTPPATQPATQPRTVPQTRPAFNPYLADLVRLAHVEKRGSGPVTMVLIPDVGCDWSVFGEFMERNLSRYTMYAVTLPGFGGSDPPPAVGDDQFGAWLDNAFQAVWTFMRESNLENTVVVGHSMGGHIALRLGCDRAKRIRAIVSIGGGPASPTMVSELTPEQRIAGANHFGANLKAMSEAEWKSNQRESAARMMSDPARAAELGEMYLKPPADTVIHYMVEYMAADIRPKLKQLKYPTLIIANAATPDPSMNGIVQRIWGQLMKDAPTAKIAFFQNTRHFVFDERRKEVDAAIDDFLNGKEPKGYTMPTGESAR